MSAFGPAARLYTVRPGDLGLPAQFEAPETLYNAVMMAELRRALAEAFGGPLFYAVEVGQGDRYTPGRGRVHAHVIAHAEDGPVTLSRSGEGCKPVYDPAGLLTYLQKPPERWSLDAELDALAARVLSEGGRLPQTRGHLRSAARFAWVAGRTAAAGAANTLCASFSPPPPSAPVPVPLSGRSDPRITTPQLEAQVIVTAEGKITGAAPSALIVVTAAQGITDQVTLESGVRRNLTDAAKVARGMAREAYLRPAAAERKGGRPRKAEREKPGVNLPQVSKPDQLPDPEIIAPENPEARDETARSEAQAAEAVGLTRSQYRKGKKITADAPERLIPYNSRLRVRDATTQPRGLSLRVYQASFSHNSDFCVPDSVSQARDLAMGMAFLPSAFFGQLRRSPRRDRRTRLGARAPPRGAESRFKRALSPEHANARKFTRSGKSGPLSYQARR